MCIGTIIYNYCLTRESYKIRILDRLADCSFTSNDQFDECGIQVKRSRTNLAPSSQEQSGGVAVRLHRHWQKALELLTDIQVSSDMFPLPLTADGVTLVGGSLEVEVSTVITTTSHLLQNSIGKYLNFSSGLKLMNFCINTYRKINISGRAN